jgi:uncharacterized membrane protein YccF (DUF307 family)
MRLLGNIIWFFLGGWLLFIVYAISALLFFPMFIPLFRLALYALWPFGRDVVTRAQLDQYRQAKNVGADTSTTEEVFNNISGLLNVLWMFTFGWILALCHLTCSFINLLLFWTIVAIPNIGGHWKLIRVAFLPFNKVIVPSNVAQEITDGIAKAKLGI